METEKLVLALFALIYYLVGIVCQIWNLWFQAKYRELTKTEVILQIGGILSTTMMFAFLITRIFN